MTSWAKANPEKARAWNNKWYKANREKRIEDHRRYSKLHPNRTHFTRARARAEKKGIVFTLKFSDVVWPEFCPVLGLRLERNSGGGPSDNSPTFDRIDSARGYVAGNVIVVSNKANRIKSNASVDEISRVVDFYRRLV